MLIALSVETILKWAHVVIHLRDYRWLALTRLCFGVAGEVKVPQSTHASTSSKDRSRVLLEWFRAEVLLWVLEPNPLQSTNNLGIYFLRRSNSPTESSKTKS